MRRYVSHQTLVMRALQAERVLKYTAPPSAYPWDVPPRQPSGPKRLNFSEHLSALATAGQHAEAAVFSLACHENGLYFDFGAINSLLVSAAHSDGLVLTPTQVAHMVGLGQSLLPGATIFGMLEGHCEHGRYTEALGLAAELVRVDSPLAQRAQLLVLQAGAAAPQRLSHFSGKVGVSSSSSSSSSGNSLAEMTVRALLDHTLAPAEARVYSGTLVGLMRSPSTLHDAGLARSLWEACTALQASAPTAAPTPLATSMYSFLLSAAVVNGDAATLRGVLAHYASCSAAAGSLPERLLIRSAFALAEARQWEDALDALALARAALRGEGVAPGLFPQLQPPTAAPTIAQPLQCPLWGLCFSSSDAPSASAPPASPMAPTDDDSAFPPSTLDSVPSELLLVELSIQALSQLGRHAEAIALWQRERVQDRLLEHFDSAATAAAAAAALPGSSAAAGLTSPSSSATAAAVHSSAAGECLPHVIASHLATGSAPALAPLMDTLLSHALPLTFRPELLKAYSDWVLATAPSHASPDALMHQLLAACPGDLSRPVTAYLLHLALRLYSPAAAGPLLLDSSGRLSGAWAEESEGSGTLDLHFSLQGTLAALESTRFNAFLAILGTMHARGITLPEEAPHAAALYALRLQASVGDSPEQLQQAVAQWVASHPLHTGISLLSSSLAVLRAVSRCCASLPPRGAAAEGSAAAAAAADTPTTTTTTTTSPHATAEFVYRALVLVSRSLADAVVASLGSSTDAQPLTPLEMSLRLVAMDVLAVAQACRQERLLTLSSADSSSSSSTLQQMLASVLLPLNRQSHSSPRPLPSYTGDQSSASSSDSLSLSPLPLLHSAGSLLSLLAQNAREDPSALAGWSSQDIEGFLLAARHVAGDVQLWEDPTVPRTLQALLELHQAKHAPTPLPHFHPLRVSFPAFSALVTHLASTGAAWTLARALSAVSLEEAPAYTTTLAGSSSSSSTGLQAAAITSSAIHVPEHLAQAAVIADASVHLVEAARSRWYDAQFLSATMTQWVREVGGAGGRAESRAAAAAGAHVPWTSLLHAQEGASGSSLPSIAVDKHGRALRCLPPPPTSDALLSAAFDSFLGPQQQGEASAAGAGAVADAGAGAGAIAAAEGSEQQGTSIFGDAVVPLLQGLGGGGQAAVLLPPRALPRLLRVAQREAASSSGQSPLPILVRELLRLGVWVDSSSLDILADAAARDPALLLPLLMHMRAQAVAVLQVLPGISRGPLLATLLPHVPLAGLGFSQGVCMRLVAAAVSAGNLRLALELLQAGPSSHYQGLHPGPGLRLLELARREGEGAVAERLAALLPEPLPAPMAPGAAAAATAAAAAAAAEAAAAARPSYFLPRASSNFFHDHLESLTSKWLRN